MSLAQFKASVRQQATMTIIDLYGDLDDFAEPALNTAYHAAADQSSGAILLDFSHVDYINSTGIVLLVELLVQARKARRRILACGLDEHYQEIFRIAHLPEFMIIFPDVTSALSQIEDLNKR
jgi:anti-sigma B factor antagonist